MKILSLGNDYLITNPTSGTEVESIGKGIYKVAPTDKGIHVRYDRAEFKLPEKILGTTHSDVARLIGNELLLGEPEPVGTLLTGLKGMGKTDTLYYIANECINKSDYAVFIIEKYVPAELLRILIKASGGKCVILIDEYGKKFSDSHAEEADESDKAESLLELLNDRSIGRTLFLLADNSTGKISNYLLNRPQRIKFHVRYDALPQDVIDEMTAGITDELYLNYLKLYVKENQSAISYDVYRTVIEVVNDCLARGMDIAGLMNTLDYYNVPSFTFMLPKVFIKLPYIETESQDDKDKRKADAVALFNDNYKITYDEVLNMATLHTSDGKSVKLSQADDHDNGELADDITFSIRWAAGFTLTDENKVRVETVISFPQGQMITSMFR